MTSSICLNCSIVGPNVTEVFGVQVLLDNSISDLKKIIKELEHELNEINVHWLVIWKVSDSPQPICHHWCIVTPLQLRDPLLSEHIVTTLKGLLMVGTQACSYEIAVRLFPQASSVGDASSGCKRWVPVICSILPKTTGISISCHSCVVILVPTILPSSSNNDDIGDPENSSKSCLNVSYGS